MFPVNEVFQGDCTRVLRRLPDSFVDLVVTDPPYGVRYQDSKIGQWIMATLQSHRKYMMKRLTLTLDCGKLAIYVRYEALRAAYAVACSGLVSKRCGF